MNLRKYGNKPYKVAVIHGGPGATGSLKPVCEELAKELSVLEPLQTEKTVENQMKELKKIIEENTTEPIVLVGHSWGAMLIYMFAAIYSQLVKKIILVSSGSLEEKYYKDLYSSREMKLTEQEREKLSFLRTKLSNKEDININKYFAEFGALMEKLDTYKSLETPVDERFFSYEIFRKVWKEAHSLRKTGKMYEMGKDIKCSVVAIHGDYDSHPAYGIRESLEKVVKDLRFYELKKCGHSPWNEFYAKDEFYKILREEIKK